MFSPQEMVPILNKVVCFSVALIDNLMTTHLKLLLESKDH